MGGLEKMESVRHAWARWVLTIAVCGIFLWAGIGKVIAPDKFMLILENYQLFPYKLAVLVAYFIPSLEIVCGCSLFSAKLRNGAWCILTLLMVSFIIVLCISWARGLDISCGCFSTGKKIESYPLTLLRDAFILGIIIMLGYFIGIFSFKKHI